MHTPSHETSIIVIEAEELVPAKMFDDASPILVHAVWCKHCGSLVYSRCASDRRNCQCGSIAVAGGVVPTEVTYKLPVEFSWVEVIVDKDLNTLYYDWLLNVDRFGLVFPNGSRRHVSTAKYVLEVRRRGQKAPDSVEELYVRGVTPWPDTF